MKQTTKLFVFGILTVLLLVPVAAGQEKKPESEQAPKQEPAAEVWVPEAERVFVEFGYRYFWGNVFGRPDLPFRPDIATSKLNEYTDIRRNFLLRRARINVDNLFGRNNYFDYQTQKAFYRDQGHLATFGQYGKFKAQFRYDEIPHIFTNTARTLYAETQPGIFTLPGIIRQSLQTASSTGTAGQIANSLPSFVATQVVPSEQFIVPQLQRRAGAGLFTYNLTPNWSAGFAFVRERQTGTRPIGTILNPSPSASASSQPGTTANRQSPGTGVELPEPIDYWNNSVRAATEYGRSRWAFQLGYAGSFFESKIRQLLFDAPFATADIPVQIIPPGSGCTPTPPAVNCAISSVPAHGQMALYPDNQAHYASGAAAFDGGRYLHLAGSATGGWLRQDDPFFPYTANTAITGLAPLPDTSLHGDKQTLAMNWTAVSKLTKNVHLEAKYRHYDYNNNTRVFELTPIEGDVIGPNGTATGQAAPALTDTEGRSNPGFNRKTLELSGSYLFGKRSAARLGWEGEWFDRSHRDADHSFENTVFGTVDYSPRRDLLLRLSARRQDRKPHVYQDPAASDPATGTPISCTSTSVVFTEEQRCHRRFDEAARILDRAEALVQYDLSRFTFSGSFQTVQTNFNRRGESNSPVPLNFVPGNAGSYFLYGFMNDLSWIYSFDASYAFSPAASAFAEYTHELYHRRMVSRNRTPTSGTILTCGGCDTANNDWESFTRDIFDTYAVGLDFYLGKRVWFSPYYSLAAGKGNVLSRAIGDPGIKSGPNQFVLTGGSVAENYPQTTTRIHEAAAVFKYKLRENLMPRFEFRYQQFNNLDYQTSVMTPYMGCIGAGAVVVSPPCVNIGPNLAAKFPSLFWPGFVVGDTAAARYLFLGADQPSYRAYIITATLEYHF